MRTWMRAGCVVGLLATAVAAEDPHPAFANHLSQNREVASTIPGNGDVNPYGVAVVPRSTGALLARHILVSNFNNSKNLQGTGSTIDQIAPDGTVTIFAQIAASDVPGCTGGVGLTTALVVLRAGWVIVGSLPTTDGTSATAQAGCLIVLNKWGKPVTTLTQGVNGPWDMTALDLGKAAVLFVTNVLNGTLSASGATVNQGNVLRILLALGDDGGSDHPRVIAQRVIASGFPERTDPAALVIGPTGVGLGEHGTLYVADTLGNRIAAIPDALFRNTDAGTGETVTSGGALNGPLGLAIAPGGDILTVNGGDGNMVETTPGGSQVLSENIDTTNTGGGTLFGLAVTRSRVYYVNDGNNTLNVLH